MIPDLPEHLAQLDLLATLGLPDLLVHLVIRVLPVTLD